MPYTVFAKKLQRKGSLVTEFYICIFYNTCGKYIFFNLIFKSTLNEMKFPLEKDLIYFLQ